MSEIKNPINSESVQAQKEMLTSDEAARYMGISKSYLYKLTSKKEIPHYKPLGKVCYFKREELIQWLQRVRVSTSEEINAKAQTYCINHKSVVSCK